MRQGSRENRNITERDDVNDRKTNAKSNREEKDGLSEDEAGRD